MIQPVGHLAHRFPQLNSSAMTLISVVVPCRNEEKFIRKCISSIVNFELPSEMGIEILIVDGSSEDKTAEIVQEAAKKDGRIKLLSNPHKFQAPALNIGIQRATGDWILRLDAHAEYPPDYLRLCYETALRTGADNVGGLFITRPGSQSYSGRLVQALTTHRFGVGDSGFRTGASEGPADTVPYGFYPRQLFTRVGYIDERLVRGEDYEFNRRIDRCGGRVFLNPLIHIHYYNQPNLRAFLRKQLRLEGPYNAYMWYLAPYSFAPRHAITAAFLVGLIGGAALAPFTRWIAYPYLLVLLLYAGLACVSALQQAIRYREPLHLLTLPISFFLFHAFYGLGIMGGMIRLATYTAPVQKLVEPWREAGFPRIHPSPTIKQWKDLRGRPTA